MSAAVCQLVCTLCHTKDHPSFPYRVIKSTVCIVYCKLLKLQHRNCLRVDESYSRVWMRASRVVRASECQCRSRNSPRFNPGILRHTGFWGAADEAVLNNVLFVSQYKGITMYSTAHVCKRKFHNFANLRHICAVQNKSSSTFWKSFFSVLRSFGFYDMFILCRRVRFCVPSPSPPPKKKVWENDFCISFMNLWHYIGRIRL